MVYTSAKILSDKANYIYQQNSNSALFVRVASHQLDTNNVSSAVEILNKGLKIYPDHPVAYLLLGKAYTLLGNYNLAEEFIRKGSSLIQCRETYEYYLGEVSRTREQRSMFNITRDKLIQKPPVSDELSESESNLSSRNTPENSNEIAKRIDDRFERLVSTLSKVKAIEKNDSEHSGPDQSKTGNVLLVSETLAKIYDEQGEFNEAIRVYEKLIERDKEKSGYYSEKIDEIRRKISSQ